MAQSADGQLVIVRMELKGMLWNRAGSALYRRCADSDQFRCLHGTQDEKQWIEEEMLKHVVHYKNITYWTG